MNLNKITLFYRKYNAILLPSTLPQINDSLYGTNQVLFSIGEQSAKNYLRNWIFF